MLHPWKSEQMVKEHLNTILKEAEAPGIANPAKGDNSLQHSLLKRIGTGLRGVLHDSGGQLVDQGRISSQTGDCLTPM